MVMCMRAVSQWSWTSVSLCVIVGDSHQLTAHSTPPQSLPNSRSQEERWCGGCKTRGSADSSWILGRKSAARMEWRQQTGYTVRLSFRDVHVKVKMYYYCYFALFSAEHGHNLADFSPSYCSDILTFPCTVFLNIYISKHFYWAIFNVLKHANDYEIILRWNACALFRNGCWLLILGVEGKSDFFIGGIMCMWLQLFLRLYERSLLMNSCTAIRILGYTDCVLAFPF